MNSEKFKKLILDYEIIELAKKTGDVIHKTVVSTTKDVDTKEMLENYVQNSDEFYDVAEKIMGNVGNLLEANLDEMHESEEFIESYSPNVGDHVYVLRPADTIKSPTILSYTHHGIYIGEGKVIHYLASSVTYDTLDVFRAGYKVRLKEDSIACYSAEEIVDRANSRLGENEYNLVFNNCEHFCRWCRCGK